MTPAQTKRLQALISAYGNASFECGDWDGNGSYDEVAAKCETARATLKLYAENPTRIYTTEDVAAEVRKHVQRDD